MRFTRKSMFYYWHLTYKVKHKQGSKNLYFIRFRFTSMYAWKATSGHIEISLKRMKLEFWKNCLHIVKRLCTIIVVRRHHSWKRTLDTIDPISKTGRVRKNMRNVNVYSVPKFICNDLFSVESPFLGVLKYYFFDNQWQVEIVTKSLYNCSIMWQMHVLNKY